MTIYILSNDHAETASMLDDRSLSRMITSIAESIVAAYHTAIAQTCYHPEYLNKPPLEYKMIRNEWPEWTRSCLANYHWMVELGMACCLEYTFRFSEMNFNPKLGLDVFHKHQHVIEWVKNNTPELSKKVIHPLFGEHEIVEILNDGWCELKLERSDGSVSSCGDWVGNLITSLPLIPHRVYKSWFGCAFYNEDDDIKNNATFLAYQAYFKYKIQAGLRRKVKCIRCQILTESSCGDENCNNGKISKPIIPVWSRREKADWLNLTLTGEQNDQNN